MIKKICYIAISCIIGCLFIGCSEADDVANNVLSEVVGTSENENVLAVKNGSPEAYPDITYGVAFKKYFGSPKWEYFKGVKEGPDDDGDGKADYTEEDIDIVEFKGKCLYQDVEVEALIQFTLNGDTFEATYLSYNDVPQSKIMLAALLQSVFNDEDLQEDGKKDISEKDTSKKDNYPNLQSFIECICSFSDPPELEEDEEEKYFKEQYDIWRNKEGYYEVYRDKDGMFYYDENYEYQ